MHIKLPSRLLGILLLLGSTRCCFSTEEDTEGNVKYETSTADSGETHSSYQRRALSGPLQWVQIGRTIQDSGNSVAMSSDGNRVCNGGHGVYRWNGSSWQRMGQELGVDFGISTMSGNGFRVGVGDVDSGGGSGQVRVYKWNGNSWELVGNPLDGEPNVRFSGEGFFGYHMSMSSDGQRMVINGDLYYPGPVVYEFKMGDWIKMPEVPGNIDLCCTYFDDDCGYDYDDLLCDDYNHVAMSGNGGRIAFGGGEHPIYFYEWHGSVWKPMTGSSTLHGVGDDNDFFGIAMSYAGHRVAIGTPGSGYVGVYEWKGSWWEQMGKNITGENPDDDFGYSVSMSNNGRRLVVGSPDFETGFRRHPNGTVECTRNGRSALPGYASIFEWDGSQWKQMMTDDNFVGDNQCDNFGGRYGVAMSGNGERVAVKGDGYFRVFQLEEKEQVSFPTDFHKVTCTYRTCLVNLRNKFGSPPRKFGDATLDGHLSKSRSKVVAAKRDIDSGNVLVSVDRLRQAMKFIELAHDRATEIGKENAVRFAANRGNLGTWCTIQLVLNFINELGGRSDDVDNVLNGRVRPLLAQARRVKQEGKYKLSVFRCYQAIQLVLEAMGQERIPVCP